MHCYVKAKQDLEVILKEICGGWNQDPIRAARRRAERAIARRRVRVVELVVRIQKSRPLQMLSGDCRLAFDIRSLQPVSGVMVQRFSEVVNV